MSVHEAVDSTSADARISRTGGQARRRWRLPRRRVAGRALVLHDSDLAPGAALLDALRVRTLAPEVVRVDRGRRLPDPGSLQLAIVVGTARLSGADAPAWLDRQVDWLRRADRTGAPVLALGSAAQALAIALGGEVQHADRTRRSWIRVTTAAPALIAPGPWLAWDDDLILLPPGAELLAHDQLGPQAFRINKHVGVQFHPEATPETVAAWVLTSKETLDFQGIMEATWRDRPVASEASRRLFAEFAASVA